MLSFPLFSAALLVPIDLFMTGLYIRDVARGIIRPHVFTWFIWVLLQGIATAATFHEKAWIGGITLLAGSLQCLMVFILSLKRGERNMTRQDWVAFILTLCAIPLWQVSQDPLLAVILVSLIDASGTSFTFRKAWRSPFEEQAKLFWTYSFTGVLRLFTMSPLNATTTVYPLTVLVLDFSLAILIVARRIYLKTRPLQDLASS